MKLYYSPVSSYSQKALVAFHEKGAAFTPEIVNMMDPAARAAYRAVNPYCKVPTLVLDDGTVIIESSIIIDYIDVHAAGAKLIPDDRELAREVRAIDRSFDLYLNDPMTTVFFDSRKPLDRQNPGLVAEARATIETTYDIFEKHFEKRTWAVGDSFTMADCSAAPSLNYASMFAPFGNRKNLTAYLGRLRERPSFARVLTEAAPILKMMMGAAG